MTRLSQLVTVLSRHRIDPAVQLANGAVPVQGHGDAREQLGQPGSYGGSRTLGDAVQSLGAALQAIQKRLLAVPGDVQVVPWTFPFAQAQAKEPRSRRYPVSLTADELARLKIRAKDQALAAWLRDQVLAALPAAIPPRGTDGIVQALSAVATGLWPWLTHDADRTAKLDGIEIGQALDLYALAIRQALKEAEERDVKGKNS